MVAGGIYYASKPDTSSGGSSNTTIASQPTTETQAGWKPITNARVAREAAATTQADGTIWIFFGGLESDGSVSGRHEGYDPAIDSWKGGDELPVPVQHAMAVTWQGTPCVMGGWRAEGTNTQIATDKVWRVVNSRWVELPPLLQPPGRGCRSGGRWPHCCHRRCGRRRQAAQHHRGLRRHGVEACGPNPNAEKDVGRRVGRQGGVHRRRKRRGPTIFRRWRRMTRLPTPGRRCRP